MVININKTAQYLVVFLGFYDHKVTHLLKKVVKTGYYVHDELREDNYGNEILIKCPKKLNTTSIFKLLDEQVEVLEIYERGADKIIRVDFKYPEILKSIVSGKYGELKDNKAFLELQDSSILKHIKAIVYKEDKAVKRFQRILFEQKEVNFSLKEIKDSNLELELPFKYEKESLFYTCPEKYIYSNFYQPDYDTTGRK
jgi:hypothetical protein